LESGPRIGSGKLRKPGVLTRGKILGNFMGRKDNGGWVQILNGVLRKNKRVLGRILPLLGLYLE